MQDEIPSTPPRQPGAPPCAGVCPAACHVRLAIDGASEGLLTFDSRLRALFHNRRLTEILAVPDAVLPRCTSLLEVLGASPLLDGAAARRLHETCLAAVAGAVPGETLVAAPDGGRRRHIHAAVRKLADGNLLMCFRDMTERLAAEATAVELAMTDPLTELPNRRLFGDRLRMALGEHPADEAPNGEHAVLLVDLDRFKPVNDTLGHSVGDGLLRLVATRLRTVVRAADIVARLGGDEFAILLSPAPDGEALRQLAGRIVDVLGRPYLVDGHLVNVSASLGFACSPADGHDHDQLLRSADLALYEAKSAGRGGYAAFRPELDSRALARRSLEIDLRRALALREFELFYQPQIDLESETVVGFEALLRWRNPARGLVPPVEFIPLAEEIGLIVPLGEWVLREACREAVGWPASVSLAVNVSPCQFENTARLIDSVSAALTGSGLPGHRLELEITESVLLRDETSVLETLHTLRAMGIKVAMDDFGTGYSSLSQLHSFPFDKIKIDRSFVKGNGASDGRNAIVRAITALGTSLGMSTIAEGVETPDQLARIRAEGCRSVQGYLFSRPVPSAEVERLITSLAQPRHPAPSISSREEVPCA